MIKNSVAILLVLLILRTYARHTILLELFKDDQIALTGPPVLGSSPLPQPSFEVDITTITGRGRDGKAERAGRLTWGSSPIERRWAE